MSGMQIKDEDIKPLSAQRKPTKRMKKKNRPMSPGDKDPMDMLADLKMYNE